MLQHRLLLLLCIVLSDNLVAQTSVSLKGRVTNNALAPVRNASVHLLSTNLRAITNEEGGFEITDIAPGNYTVQVHAAGFVQQQTTVSLENSFFLDIKLEQLSTYLDEVIVTAQKREEQLRNIPFSLSVISSREARQFRLWNSEDLTGIVPNLYAADPGDNRNVISIRGVTSTSYDPAVVTYVDGVSQFSLDTYIAELLDIERIEVLRGPQGTLYGRNAMGGVINIITKQPGNKPGGFAEVNAGSFGLQRYAAGLRFPLIKNKLYAGVAAAFTKHSGYYTNEFDGSAFDRQKSVTSNYYIRYLPGSRWSLTLNLKQRAARNSGAFPLVFTAEEALQRPFMLTQNNVATMKDNILNASLSVMRAGTAFNFSSQTAWQRNYRYYTGSVDADFSALDAYAIYNNYGRSFNTSEVITQEFKLVSAPSSAGLWKWTAGSYLFMQDNPVKQATRFGQDAKLAGAPDSLFSIINTTTARNYGISFYGQANRIITSKLELIVGLRYDWERKKLSILSEYQKDPDPDPLFPLVPDTAAKILLDAFSPRVGLLFHASEQVNIYFNYGRGYRPGGLTQLSSDPMQPPLFPYEPEYTNSLELGMKATVGRKLYAAAAVFYTAANNIQVPTLILPDAITITRNAGRAISKGIEIELRSAPVKNLQLIYNFGYTDAQYKTLRLSLQGEEKNLSGNRQVFTPEATSVLALQYDIPVTSKTKFVIRSEWFYSGTRYFDLANTMRQSPYHLLNLKAGISVDGYELMFWSRNATDNRYIDYAYDYGGVHLGNPRIYGVTAHKTF